MGEQLHAQRIMIQKTLADIAKSRALDALKVQRDAEVRVRDLETRAAELDEQISAKTDTLASCEEAAEEQQLLADGWTYGRTVGRTDNERSDGRSVGWMEGRTDDQSHGRTVGRAGERTVVRTAEIRTET